jgi:hypothetical protein
VQGRPREKGLDLPGLFDVIQTAGFFIRLRLFWRPLAAPCGAGRHFLKKMPFDGLICLTNCCPSTIIAFF